MNISNAKQLFFTNKQHFLNFRAAWSQAVRSPKAKTTLVDAEDYAGNPIRIRHFGWLNAVHHLVYVALCGKDLRKSFTPVTNPCKLENQSQMHPLSGLINARSTLDKLATLIDKGAYPYACYIRYKTSEVNTINEEFLAAFLAPFAGTVTTEMLSKLAKVLPPTPEQYRQDGVYYPRLVEALYYSKP